MSLKFSGASVEECVEKACSQYNVTRDELKYRIVKNEKHFFKKIVEIEVIQENIKKVEEVKIENEKSEEISVAKQKYGAKVQDGKIIVNDFEDDVTLTTIEPCENVILLVNGVQTNSKISVSADDNITYKFVEQEAVRDVKVSITTDKLEAYVTIDYKSQDEYKLVDCDYSNNLQLKVKKVGKKMPPKYTEKELKEILSDKGVRYGILEEELKEVCQQESVVEKLIAKGVPAIDDVPDKINLYFSDVNELVDYDTNDNKVDYRNRYLISNVQPGDVIAELIPGKEGKDGTNVLGLTIKKRPSKKLMLKAGENCTFKENKIISNVEGKPSIKGNTIAVNQVYKCEEVDLKSGNINFVGNVEIAKNVNEGMEVIAGQDLSVGKNVESANLQAGGNIDINGNVIASTIKSGADNVEVKMHKEDLMIYNEYVKQIIESAAQLRDRNMLEKSRYGEIVKLLIENKFRNMPSLSKKILKYNSESGRKDSLVSKFIISKILGLGPLKIEGNEELEEFSLWIEEEIDDMEGLGVNSADISISYAQGSTIEASGNVIITGKGQYTSNIVALGNIEFISDHAVCRGGELSAGNEIKLKTVGSVAGVNTVLKVPKTGKISADIAYSNTLFCFGEKQMMLEVSSKEVNAYIDKTGEIIIDKFVL